MQSSIQKFFWCQNYNCIYYLKILLLLQCDCWLWRYWSFKLQCSYDANSVVYARCLFFSKWNEKLISCSCHRLSIMQNSCTETFETRGFGFLKRNRIREFKHPCKNTLNTFEITSYNRNNFQLSFFSTDFPCSKFYVA